MCFYVYLTWDKRFIFRKELNNPHHCFAFAENAILPGKICRELLIEKLVEKLFWCTMTAGAEFSAEVISVFPKISTRSKADRKQSSQ